MFTDFSKTGSAWMGRKDVRHRCIDWCCNVGIGLHRIVRASATFTTTWKRSSPTTLSMMKWASSWRKAARRSWKRTNDDHTFGNGVIRSPVIHITIGTVTENLCTPAIPTLKSRIKTMSGMKMEVWLCSSISLLPAKSLLSEVPQFLPFRSQLHLNKTPNQNCWSQC